MSTSAKDQWASALGRYKPYHKYKDSGVEWLGEIPEQWSVRRIKVVTTVRLSNVDKNAVDGQDVVRLCNYQEVYHNERISSSLDFMNATATHSQIVNFSLRAGDVLITKDSESWTDIAVSAVVVEDLPGVLCGYHLALLRPAAGCHGAFLARSLVANGMREQFEVAANGVTRFGLSKDAIGAAVLLIPPLPEQLAISAFLDRETAKIDALTEKKERLIELLQEKRIALITHAVTKGLDPDVPMKDSGVEWLGKIPAHWEVKPLMRLTSDERPIMYGIVLPGPDVDDGVLIVKGGDVAPGRLRAELLSRTTREIESSYARSRLRTGDIVYAILGSIGAAELVPKGIEGANLTQDAARVAVRLGTCAEWLLHCLRSRATFSQLEAGINGAAVRGINIGDLKRVLVPVPPKDEQLAIAAFLDRETAKIDALMAKVRTAIELLKEYRTALISAAVTGKIDVRGEVS